MLRTRTAFSFGQATNTVEDYVCWWSYQQWAGKAAVITDSTAYGWGTFQRECEQFDLRPVYGAEINVSMQPLDRRPISDGWLFFPWSRIGRLNQLLARALKNNPNNPTIGIDDAIEFARNYGVVVMGHRATEQMIWQMLDQAPGSTFLGLSPATPKMQLDYALSQNGKICATSCNRYFEDDDHWHALYEVSCKGYSAQTYNQAMLTPEDWHDELRWVDTELRNEAVNNTKAILKESRAKLNRGRLPPPEMERDLVEICAEALDNYLEDLEVSAETEKLYERRLEHELKVIYDKGFEDYFFIVSEMVQDARENMLVGPGRGSSCGSLVCFLLEITTSDPIEHGLLFERFIDESRNDLPDIDIDFPDHDREKVFEFLKGRYGEDCVARLGTVNYFRERSAAAEVGRALRLPKWQTEAAGRDYEALEDGFDDLAEELPASVGAIHKDEPAFWFLMHQLNGMPRHAGQHAAGVVISDRPINEIVPVDPNTGATQCDMRDAEGVFGLLKIDVLGLTQLSIMQEVLGRGRVPDALAEPPTPGTLPRFDRLALEQINSGKLCGVFQFSGATLRRLVAKLGRLETFDDIVTLSALARPGPIDSGAADTWIERRRQGYEPDPDNILAPYLKETLGVIVYQEQVMRIARNIGALDWPAVNQLRRIMGKSKGAEAFEAYGEAFIGGARARGLDDVQASKIWAQLCANGAYAFNKSHAVAYGLLSWQTAFLKAWRPLEYAAAMLNAETDKEKQIETLREICGEGVDYVPFDRDLSDLKWRAIEKDARVQIIGPLTNLEGIGPQLAEEISETRRNGQPLSDRLRRIMDKGLTKLDSLWPIRDAVHRLMPDPIAMNITSTPLQICDLEPQFEPREVMMIGVVEEMLERDDNGEHAVARRGYELKDENTQTLSLTVRDDTGQIKAKVPRWAYDKLRTSFDECRPGKSIYAVRGKLLGSRGQADPFRLVMVDRVKRIGDLDEAAKL